MKNFPLVSICIPTYNGEKYILQALESAVAQTYPKLEIIISDDASKDRTLQIVKKFQEANELEIRIFHHIPCGIGANWNNCIEHARGDYIKFLFQDDLLFPTCVEELLAPFFLHKNLGLAACKREILVEGKNDHRNIAWLTKYLDLQKGMHSKERDYFIFTKENLKDHKFVKNNKIGEPSTILFKKSILKNTGLFNEDLLQVVDFEFYYRLLKNYTIIVIDKKLAAFRVHPAQATNLNKTFIKEDYFKYWEILYKNYFFYLGYKTQKKLFKKHHWLGKLYIYLRH